MNLVDYLARSERVKRALPGGVKRAFRRLLPFADYSVRVWERQAPFPGIAQRFEAARGGPRFAILTVPHHWHEFYAAACQELGFSYAMVDAFADDWLARLEGGGFDAVLVWPGVSLSPWKQLLDERLAVVDRQLRIPQFPEYEATWIYESKRRMHYWLAANGFPEPATSVFYRRDEAEAFASACELPVVMKVDIGACSQGVRILRERRALKRAIRAAFGRGIAVPGRDGRDRQWGSILLQAFVANAREWRMIRVGESYFGYEKIAENGFHSGTSERSYMRPPDELLNLTRRVTDVGRFSSMSVDVLLDESGRAFITELQGVFGLVHDHACMVGGAAGRMVDRGGAWDFEAGEFCRNRLCNERVLAASRVMCGETTEEPA